MQATWGWFMTEDELKQKIIDDDLNEHIMGCLFCQEMAKVSPINRSEASDKVKFRYDRNLECDEDDGKNEKGI